MILVIFLLIIAILCIIGCFVAKKTVIKVLLGVIGTFLAAVLIIFGAFYYDINFKVKNVDTNISPEGEYTLILQAIGEPVFFSKADGRIVLKEGKKTIVKCGFSLYDDGGSIRSDVWKVTWKDNLAEIIISGEEQNDEMIIIYKDGRSEYITLDTKYGKTKEEREEEVRKQIAEYMEHKEQDADNFGLTIEHGTNEQEAQLEYDDGYPISEDYQEYKIQFSAIDKFIKEEGSLSAVEDVQNDTGISYEMTSKGWPYAIIYTGKGRDGNTEYNVEWWLKYNEAYIDEVYNEYILEERYYDSNGMEMKSPAILDFYIIDKSTMEVIDEKTTEWH